MCHYVGRAPQGRVLGHCEENAAAGTARAPELKEGCRVILDMFQDIVTADKIELFFERDVQGIPGEHPRTDIEDPT